MNTFRTSTEITPEHRIVLALPPDMPLGTAEVVVTVASQKDDAVPRGNLRSHFGTIRSGESRAADNDRIDADLTDSYRHTHD